MAAAVAAEPRPTSRPAPWSNRPRRSREPVAYGQASLPGYPEDPIAPPERYTMEAMA